MHTCILTNYLACQTSHSEDSGGGLVKVTGLAVRGENGRLQRVASLMSSSWVQSIRVLFKVKQLTDEQKEAIASLSKPSQIDTKVGTHTF